MLDSFVSPERRITIAGNPFTLDGSFKTLRSVQHAFNQDILFVQARVLDMRQDEIARLLSIATGKDEEEVGQLLFDELDVAGVDYQFLKAELLAWLAVAMTPKKDREKKSQQMAGVIANLTVSPGRSTNSSVSERSAGTRKRSGKATSGK